MDNVIPTLHARMIRGTTKIIDRIYRDSQGRPVDLTGAKIWYTMSADPKVAPSVFLTSVLPASISPGTLGTVFQAKQGGDDIELQLVADGGATVTIDESLITSGLSVVNRLVKAHFQNGVHHTVQLEAALNLFSTIMNVRTPSTLPNYVLQNGDATNPTALVGGPPNAWRTGIVIDPDQNSFRGHYTITITPADTESLVAMGDDDPWYHECDVQLTDGSVNPDFGLSKMSLYPETTDVP